MAFCSFRLYIRLQERFQGVNFFRPYQLSLQNEVKKAKAAALNLSRRGLDESRKLLTKDGNIHKFGLFHAAVRHAIFMKIQT